MGRPENGVDKDGRPDDNMGDETGQQKDPAGVGEIERRVAESPLESAARYARGGDAADSGGSAGNSRADQCEKLLRWADQQNLHGRGSIPLETESGGEHEVWHDPATGRVFKATHPGQFGMAASGRGFPGPADYLHRLALDNVIFGSDIRLEGVRGRDEEMQIITSHPFVHGRKATPEEIVEFFEEKGFEPLGQNRWVMPELRVVVGDAVPRNIYVTTNGETVPIDLQIEQLSERRMREIC